MRFHHVQQSVQNWHLVTEVGYNICIILGILQCILGQGELVMVVAQTTEYNNYAKIIIHDFNIYFRQSTWECQDCQEYFARISLEWDMDIGRILFTLSYVKYKQFDYSLVVNGKSIERKAFPSVL